MFYHIVVNTTENDAMHARMLILDGVEEIAAAGANHQVVALVWECGGEAIMNAQLNLLWNELIPAKAMENNQEEIAFVNSIIDSVLSDNIF